MLQNYLKIALRNILRYRTYSLLNVVGLSLGLACGMLILLLVIFHLSFDRYHSHSDRTYRVVTEIRNETISYSRGTPKPLAEALRKTYPFIETVARVERVPGRILGAGDDKASYVKKFKEAKAVCYAEPSLFKVFDFTWLKGNVATALSEPNAVVLTQAYARKYFGAADPIGQILRLDEKINLTVTGLLADPPANTNLDFDVFISYSTILSAKDELSHSLQQWNYVDSESQCFLVLDGPNSAERLRQAFPDLVRKYFNAREARMYQFGLQPIGEVHFNPTYGGRMPQKLLYAMAAVGVFLLLIACSNFINMATALALKRSKEVGVRKVMGSTKGQLFGQFMTETAFITLLAVGLSLGLVHAGIPWLNELFAAALPGQIAFGDLLAPPALIVLAGLVLGVIVLSGFYPSLVMAGFSPVEALRGRLSHQQVGGFSLRRGLVTFQFFITQLFIIGVVVVLAQLRYIRQMDLGFEKEGILTIPVPTADPVRQQTLRNQLAGLRGIESLTLVSAAPASRNMSQTGVWFDGRPEPEKFQINHKSGDTEYLSVFGIGLVAGRNFRTNDTSTHEVLVNETFVKQLGLSSPEAVLGRRLQHDQTVKYIVGVVRDFHVNSVRTQIPPAVISNEASWNQLAALKIDLQQAPAALAAVRKEWQRLFPGQLFEHQFLEESLAQLYLGEQVMLRLGQTFALIAILIGCMGLYGLVAFMAETKEKEIGIRKVLGATLGQVLWLFGREFAKLLVMGFVAASVLGGLLMRAWLQDYHYRIQLGWWVFALAGLLSLGIACITISFQSVKAALANPVKSLRNE